MRDRPRPPAAPSIAIGLLAGVVLQGCSPAWACAAWLALLATAAVLASCGQRLGAGQPLLLLLAVVSGSALESYRQRAAELRIAASGLLPGERLETDFEATVLAAAEPGRGDSWTVRIRGAIVPVRAGQSEFWTVRLTVRGGRPGFESIRRLRRGDRVRVWLRLRLGRGRRDSRFVGPVRRMRAAGVDLLGTCKDARLVERIATGRRDPLRTLDGARAAARRTLDRSGFGDRPERLLLDALLLGDRARLGERLESRFRDAGLLHVVAISGLHLAILLWLIRGLLSRLRVGDRTATWICLVGVAAVALMLPGRASVSRSALAAVLVLSGRRIGRRSSGIAILSVVATMQLVVDPAIVWNVGFQLSHAATLGLLSTPRPSARSSTLQRALRGIVTSAVHPFLFAAPIAALHFGRLAPIGIAITPLALPAVWWTLATGIPGLAIESGGAAGGSLLGLSARGASFLALVAGLGGQLAGPARGIDRPGPWLLLAFAAVLAGMVMDRRSTTVRLLIGLLAVRLWIGPPPQRSSGLELRILDVGQGQSVLVRDGGSSMLVDAGPRGLSGYDAGARIVLPRLLGDGLRHLDILALSHQDSDHIGGARTLVETLTIDEFWVVPGLLRDPAIAALVDRCVARGIAVRGVAGGARGRLGSTGVSVLAPRDDDPQAGGNEGSLVLLVGEPPARALIPGDLGIAGERRLLARGEPVKAELLIVGHHGANGSSSPRFLDAIAPRWAVASCGWRNPFRHPAREVRSRLKARAIRLLRTDLGGERSLRATSRGWVLTRRRRTEPE